MLKLIDDMLIEAPCNPNVPGSLVAGTPGANVDPSRLDGIEEEQRAAASAAYRVCVKAHETNVGNTVPIGHVVVLEAGETLQQPACWLACNRDGWVSCDEHACPPGMARSIDEVRNVWRPLPPKPSALDEMAAAAASWNTKPTNPKDGAATGRVPLGLLSPIAKAHWALAQHCGRAKYGAWNWRHAGARASIYLDAIGRHADGYLSGETHDPADGTHHLGNIMACCAILLEAEAAGKLTDDRPPMLDMRPTYADVERRQADLTAKYADRNPKHWAR
jgi:hypothetical protein